MRSPRLSALAALATTGALLLAACSDGSTGGTLADPGSDAGGPAAEGGPPQTIGVTDPTEPTPACGAAGVKKGASTRTLTADGSKRSYELFVPDTYDSTKSFPLVFVFHGDGGSGDNIRSSFRLEAEAAGGAIFVYPDGEDETWQIDDASGLGHDIAFIDAIAADLGKTHCTDKKRVFAVGFSKGAYFANMLACLAKTPLAGVVAHSGGGPFGVDGSGTDWDNSGNLVCPRAPVAAMQIIGTNDGLLGDAKQARDYWKRLNSCKSTSKAFAPSPCVQFDGCATGRPEIYCEIPGMGHTIWQNAPKVTWSFLKSR